MTSRVYTREGLRRQAAQSRVGALRVPASSATPVAAPESSDARRLRGWAAVTVMDAATRLPVYTEFLSDADVDPAARAAVAARQLGLGGLGGGL